MLNSALSTALRETAGSESYNRYEYQVHWIVLHMIEKVNESQDFFVFCEFHDDMAETANVDSPVCMEFFQVKTTDQFDNWSLKKLLEKHKRPNGTFKNSFLGFIFYNFMQFDTECSKCHFVSNKHPDKEIRLWQSIIEDGRILKEENEDLFNKIKNLVRAEYPNLSQVDFDKCFLNFVQNTFIRYSGLPLEEYETYVMGKFFQLVSKYEINSPNAYRIFKELVDTVRAKTKAKVKIPISFKRLSEEKGISSQILKIIQQKFVSIPKLDVVCKKIENFLISNGIPPIRVYKIIRNLKQHHEKVLDVNDALYQDIVCDYTKDCTVFLNNCTSESFDEMRTFAEQQFSRYKEIHLMINNYVLEGILYEILLSE